MKWALELVLQANTPLPRPVFDSRTLLSAQCNALLHASSCYRNVVAVTVALKINPLEPVNASSSNIKMHKEQIKMDKKSKRKD